MNEQQQALLASILADEQIVCLHALGQGLVDSLCEIIRWQSRQLNKKLIIDELTPLMIKEIRCEALSQEEKVKFLTLLDEYGDE